MNYLTDGWLRWLKDDLRPYILPPQGNDMMRFTPFTQIKSFWLKAATAATNERSLSKMFWSTTGQSFQYSRPELPAVDIQLATLRKLVTLAKSISVLKDFFHLHFLSHESSLFPAMSYMTTHQAVNHSLTHQKYMVVSGCQRTKGGLS